MNNIAYVVGGLLLLMLAGHLNEGGGSPVGAVPLALLGLSAILKGLTHAGGKATAESAAAPQARIEHAVAEEPFAEEVDDVSSAKPGSQKIPAKFGRPKQAPAGPTPFRSPTAGSGQVALNSAKYLNGGKPGFRKGSVNEANDS